MTPASLLNADWNSIVARLGGAAALAVGARTSKALRRLVLADCLGQQGLRSTAPWAAAVGLVDLSNPALLYRLRQCGDWLGLLIGHLLAAAAPPPSQGRHPARAG